MRIHDKPIGANNPGSLPELQANSKLGAKIKGRNVRNLRGAQGKVDSKVDSFFQGTIKPSHNR